MRRTPFALCALRLYDLAQSRDDLIRSSPARFALRLRDNPERRWKCVRHRNGRCLVALVRRRQSECIARPASSCSCRECKDYPSTNPLWQGHSSESSSRAALAQSGRGTLQRALRECRCQRYRRPARRVACRIGLLSTRRVEGVEQEVCAS